MLDPLDDTIAAIASPPGGGGRGILRLSGPGVVACLKRRFQAPHGQSLDGRRAPAALEGNLLLEDGRVLPCRLYLWPDRRSYTGQPAAELHTFGSTALLEAALARLCRAGARPARPGEFTLRAFLAGRIDLTQAEAVLGVIDAADDAQFRAALDQLAGGLGGPLHQLRDALLELLAHLEAGFDFADEDLPFLTAEQLDGDLAGAIERVDSLRRQMKSRSEAAATIRAVLLGWPNCGKSSLFNALLARPRALVSGQPGTTRDYLTAELDLDGVECLLVDTAGAEPEAGGRPGSIGQAAQAAARGQRQQADLRILCIDGGRPLNRWEQARLVERSPRRLVVLTKSDLAASAEPGVWDVRTSSLTGEGIGTLRRQLREAALESAGPETRVVAATAARCRDSLRRAAEAMQRAREIVASAEGEELVAAELRLALDELGKVVGVVYTEDVLDRIFSRFCVGK